jgi:biotin transporter BioY
MDRALKILAALFATASVLLLGCILLAVAQYILPDFAKLQSHPRDAALLGLAFGYLVMFVLVYAIAARLIWRRKRWNMVVLLAAVSCFGFPVGPVLGIAGLILLTRPAVRAQFT